MLPDHPILKPGALARNALEKRVWITEQMELAQKEGKKREARSWSSELQKWDKLISKYDLELHANLT